MRLSVSVYFRLPHVWSGEQSGIRDILRDCESGRVRINWKIQRIWIWNPKSRNRAGALRIYESLWWRSSTITAGVIPTLKIACTELTLRIRWSTIARIWILVSRWQWQVMTARSLVQIKFLESGLSYGKVVIATSAASARVTGWSRHDKRMWYNENEIRTRNLGLLALTRVFMLNQNRSQRS